jgi:hypothetical protein
MPESEVVVILSDSHEITTVYSSLTVSHRLDALTSKVYVPAVVGVPVISPVAVLSDKPGGKVPEIIAHKYMSVPYVAT